MRDEVTQLGRRFGWDALGCLLGLLYGLPSLIYPFGADQGIHWYVGYGWLHGHMPYATGISGKPPGIFVVHAIASALFGPEQSAIRALELLSMPLLGFFVASAARTLGQALRPGAWGAATLLCSVVNYTYADYWNTAHPEHWAALCLLAGVHVASQAAHNRRRAVATGALCMAAFVLKYPAAAVAIPIALLCGLRAWREHPERRLTAFAEAAGFYSLGVGLVAGFTLLPFAITDTIGPLIEVCVDMTERYVGSGKHNTEWWPGFWAWSRGGTLLLWAATLTLLGGVSVARARDRRGVFQGMWLLVLLLSAIASVVLQLRNWSYHWVSVFPFMVALGIWGAQRLVCRGSLLLAIAVLSALAAYHVRPRFVAHVPRDYRAHVQAWVAHIRGENSADETRSRFERIGRYDRYGVQQRIAAFAKKQARPGDTLCVRGFLSPIYQASGMRCTSRHAIEAFLGFGPASWKQEYAADLRARPPTFIVTFEDRRHDLRALAKRGYVAIYREDGLVLLRQGQR